MAKFLKCFLAIYLFAFLLHALHFPQNFRKIDRHNFWYLPLAPLSSPAIIQSYLQIIFSGAWPWGKPDGVLSLDHFVTANSIYDPVNDIREVKFKVEDQFWPKGLNYVLRTDSYSVAPKNAALPQPANGLVVRIGWNFCLSTSDGSDYYFFGWPNCVQIKKVGRNLYWKDLKTSAVRRIELQ